MNLVFVLSPANCNGVRADWLFVKNSSLELAQRLGTHGAPVSEVFTFLSSLYFRGKLAYAKTFVRPPDGCPGIFIITPNMGLVPHDTPIRMSMLRAFRRSSIDVKNKHYCSSLGHSANRLAGEIGAECAVVLLGSIASGKYLKVLHPIFGRRLRVPLDFIGRGDMSRGGLLLRCVRDRRELDYIDVDSLQSQGLGSKRIKTHPLYQNTNRV